jgi:hypothetical protein
MIVAATIVLGRTRLLPVVDLHERKHLHKRPYGPWET